MKTWMVVERLENWKVDCNGEFTTIAFPERCARRLGQFSEGDQLITYVASRISAFADIRQVISQADRPKYGAQSLGRYDSVYPITLRTKPILVLPIDKWIPFKSLADQLSFAKKLNDWRNVVRSALRELNEEDAAIIRATMRRSARDGA